MCRSRLAHRMIGLVAPDLALQLDDAVEQRLGRRRAAGHVDVHRHDAVAAAHHRVGIVIVAAAVRARAHRDDPARLGHLVVDLAQRRRHLVDQRAGDDHDVRLARARAEHDAEPVEVVAGRAGVHHLDRAARETERHRPRRPGARPIDELVDRRDFEAREARPRRRWPASNPIPEPLSCSRRPAPRPAPARRSASPAGRTSRSRAAKPPTERRTRSRDRTR